MRQKIATKITATDDVVSNLSCAQTTHITCMPMWQTHEPSHVVSEKATYLCVVFPLFLHCFAPSFSNSFSLSLAMAMEASKKNIML